MKSFTRRTLSGYLCYLTEILLPIGNAEKLIFDEKTTFTSSEESEDDEASVDVTDKPEQESGHDEDSGE